MSWMARSGLARASGAWRAGLLAALVLATGGGCTADNPNGDTGDAGAQPDAVVAATDDMARTLDMAASPDLASAPMSAPPSVVWISAGGGSSTAAGGQSLDVSIGGSLTVGTVTSAGGFAFTSGLLCTETY